LQTSLEQASQKAPKGGGFLSGFFGGSQPVDKDAEEAARLRLESLRISTDAGLQLTQEAIEKASERMASDVKKLLGDARRHAKGLGEKLVTLRPSWRGSNSRLSQTGSSPAPTSSQSGAANASKVGKGKNIEHLIRSLSSVEGRQQAAAAKDAESVSVPTGVSKDSTLTKPPAEQLPTGEWWIHGVYEHQCLKAGLRVMEERWPEDGMDEFPRKKDGSNVLFRETLFRDLLSGNVRVQSILGNDIAAAQRDLSHLNLRQLLRLRVHHLEYVPSGCGADTVHAVGATQEAFMNALDSLLFKMLGRKALEGLPNTSGLDEHKAGREAVQLAAAAAAVPEPVWWCWWVTDSRRVYLDAHTLSSRSNFPEGPDASVLEITDNSKRDHHDPSGRLRWMDWKMQIMTVESELSPAPRRLEGGADKGTPQKEDRKESKVGSPGSPAVAGEAADGGQASESAAGGATASMVSPNMLKDIRKSLRKTGTFEETAKNS